MIHDPVLERHADLAAEALVLRKLWRAVLFMALKEAAGNVVNTGGSFTPTTVRCERRRARDWIGSRDFRGVCELAGVQITAEEARAVVERPDAASLFGLPRRCK